MAVYLVRHAVAIGRSSWHKADALRPLTKKGERQARSLNTVLDGADVRRVLSSPALRCLQTVEPFAAKYGLDVRAAQELAEGSDGKEAADLAVEAAAKKGDTMLCTHGDVVPEVLRCLARDGMHLDGELVYAKGSTWVLGWDGERFTEARYLPPGDLR